MICYFFIRQNKQIAILRVNTNITKVFFAYYVINRNNSNEY